MESSGFCAGSLPGIPGGSRLTHALNGDPTPRPTRGPINGVRPRLYNIQSLTLFSGPSFPAPELYRRRWAVELCFRDIKTTLGLDVLRCQTPELIEKEIWMQVLAYNLVRALMLEASWTYGVELGRLSFKGTVDTLRQWTPLFAPAMFAFKRARAELLRVIAADQVPHRPNRVEPRARKRRPKVYQLLTSPRHQMVVSPSRALK